MWIGAVYVFSGVAIISTMKQNFTKDTVSKEDIRPADWLDSIILKGVSMRASDIHIEPSEDGIRTFFRIDGVLNHVDSLPIEYHEAIISRLKVSANLDTTEHRKPQDGHILFPSKIPNQGSIDLRLSVFPSILGETAVLRILNRADLLFENLDNLGISPDEMEKLKEILHQHSGMILVTGPSGSGKTTTLYTMLGYLVSRSSGRENIVTLEDPVELRLRNIRQAQIFPEIGFDFVQGLRSILRQDANIIMVGEIRDDETVRISLRAALTGVLFLSTMHTLNSVGAIIRFTELGVPRSLVASALRLVIAQRLVRTLCTHCKVQANFSKRWVETFGIAEEDREKIFDSKGCDQCLNTGYLGRIGIFELLFIDKEIQESIIESRSFTEVEELANKKIKQTLRDAAVKKVLEGVTTFEEITRVVW